MSTKWMERPGVQCAPGRSKELGSRDERGNQEVCLRRAETGDEVVPNFGGTQRAATTVGAGHDVVVIAFSNRVGEKRDARSVLGRSPNPEIGELCLQFGNALGVVGVMMGNQDVG